MEGQSDKIVDATIRKYLTQKVREKFPEDFHLLEPVLANLVSRYTLQELLMICAVEVNRLKNGGGRAPGNPKKE